MFLNQDLGIWNRILCLNPRIRPWKCPLSCCLTLKMLQQCAWCKLLALFACLLFDLKTQSMTERSECEHAQKHLRLGQSSEATAAFMFPSYLHPDTKDSSPQVPLCSCQVVCSVHTRYRVRLIANSIGDHYKIGPGEKEKPYPNIKIKLHMGFI